MDIVYICRFGPNEELRYSLRSLVNVPHDEVWVVGGKPNWYNGNFIGVRPMADKYAHARENLKRIVLDKRISEDFILMNDDFFIIEPIDQVDYFYGGDLVDKAKKYKQSFGMNSYTTILYETIKVLKNNNCPTTYDYAIHVPMVFNKSKLKRVLKHPGSVRALYGNLYQVAGSKMEDVKVHQRVVGGPQPYDYMKLRSPFLSTNDQTFPGAKEHVLGKMFPHPSNYEYQ